MKTTSASMVGGGVIAVAVLAASFVAGGSFARAEGTDAVPPGMVASGKTWCGTVSGQYGRFLRELTPLVDAGAEVQGYLIQSDGDFSALVCKRDRNR